MYRLGRVDDQRCYKTIGTVPRLSSGRQGENDTKMKASWWRWFSSYSSSLRDVCPEKYNLSYYIAQSGVIRTSVYDNVDNFDGERANEWPHTYTFMSASGDTLHQTAPVTLREIYECFVYSFTVLKNKTGAVLTNVRILIDNVDWRRHVTKIKYWGSHSHRVLLSINHWRTRIIPHGYTHVLLEYAFSKPPRIYTYNHRISHSGNKL